MPRNTSIADRSRAGEARAARDANDADAKRPDRRCTRVHRRTSGLEADAAPPRAPRGDTPRYGRSDLASPIRRETNATGHVTRLGNRENRVVTFFTTRAGFFFFSRAVIVRGGTLTFHNPLDPLLF
jgi:hypothetical protein